MMQLRLLDVNEIRIFVTSFGSVIERFLEIAPGPRNMIKTCDVGSKSSVFVKVGLDGDISGRLFIGFSDAAACQVAGRIHKKLLNEGCAFGEVSREVKELLAEFANQLISCTVEELKQKGLVCAATEPEVGDGKEGKGGTHDFVATSFPLGEMGQMELFLSLKANVTREMTGKRIMIVDDSPSMRAMMRNILEDAGYLIVGEAANGRDAITTIPAFSPDLVTMDIEMPDIDGVQALSAIKVKHPEVIVIMVSSLSERAKVMECLAKGAANYILKPYEPQKVIEAVARALK
ncbi:MAG: response regulator [Nitrospirota bacterium]|nr:response regulator [Nitrospirota bacterium]